MTDLEYKHKLFKRATLRLLAHKYAYYVLSTNYIKDVTYDLEEKQWFTLGRELGMLNEEETSPCIDFDHEHTLAIFAKELSEYYVGSGNTDKINEFFIRQGAE